MKTAAADVDIAKRQKRAELQKMPLGGEQDSIANLL